MCGGGFEEAIQNVKRLQFARYKLDGCLNNGRLVKRLLRNLQILYTTTNKSQP